MIPHAETSATYSFGVATVLPCLGRPPMATSCSPRRGSATGLATYHSAVDVPPKATPVDDELALAILAGDDQPFHEMTSVERKNWTTRPARLRIDSAAAGAPPGMGSVSTRAPPLSTWSQLRAHRAAGPLLGSHGKSEAQPPASTLQGRIPVTPLELDLIPAGADTTAQSQTVERGAYAAGVMFNLRKERVPDRPDKQSQSGAPPHEKERVGCLAHGRGEGGPLPCGGSLAGPDGRSEPADASVRSRERVLGVARRALRRGAAGTRLSRIS